jgi:UDP-glucuronate 4-epimerase
MQNRRRRGGAGGIYLPHWRLRMQCVVTGAAGFVGSHLSRRLAGDGHDVLAVDCLRANYDPAEKEANLEWVLGSGGSVRIERLDLGVDPVDDLLAGADVVFHLAGQPGVRASWGDGITAYVNDNVVATERLLAAAVRHGGCRFVYASSSSVYGEADRYPCDEDVLPRPHSPYGVTKLAAEHLCVAYARNHALPTVALRYFSVYGPRQRPDMAVRRLLEAARTGVAFPRYGDGSQVRDLTFVGDVVEATVLAGEAEVVPGTVLNVAGGSTPSLLELIAEVEAVTGTTVAVEPLPAQPGDVTRTGGDTRRARDQLGWAPATGLTEGLTAQAAWLAGAERATS